ncbi:MAG: 2,4'-dihydroxyacetophenone dioxygenase family protein [Streptomycetales bacterium]
MAAPERSELTDFLIRTSDLPWVPQGSDNVWFKPVRISPERGSWVNLLKVAQHGIVSRHRHLAEVEGWVIQGRWYYREHDWQAEPGAYVYEPPGDVHTLVADVVDEGEPMITLFSIHGPIEYFDERGELAYVETAQTKLQRYLDHCAAAGVDAQRVVF